MTNNKKEPEYFLRLNPFQAAILHAALISYEETGNDILKGFRIASDEEGSNDIDLLATLENEMVEILQLKSFFETIK